MVRIAWTSLVGLAGLCLLGCGDDGAGNASGTDSSTSGTGASGASTSTTDGDGVSGGDENSGGGETTGEPQEPPPEVSCEDPDSLLPCSYGYELFEFPEPDDAVVCSGVGNDTAEVQQVMFAQTHAMSPHWPLFFLIGGRPALLEVDVTGEGAAPEVSVSGWIGERGLGELCLAGPEVLSAAVPDGHDRQDRFTLTLPRAWMQPGLRVEIRAGVGVQEYSEAQLDISEAPEVNLVMARMDVLNYNDGLEDKEPPASFLGDIAGAVPASKMRFGIFPERISMPRLVVGGPSPDGEGVPPIVLENRLCRGDETPETAPCTVNDDIDDGYVNAVALRMIEALNRATGDYAFSFFYGNTEHLFPGGWGGGKNFVSADFDDVTIHEMGHSMSLPHWGGSYDPGARIVPSSYRYPYGGEGEDGGGRGDSWNYYQHIDDHTSPLCEIDGNASFGLERSDAMQRNNHCVEMRSDGPGPWDGFSDFSAISIFRYLSGATEGITGDVPYARTGTSTFNLPPQGGFPTLAFADDGARELRRANPELTRHDWERLSFLTPQEWNVPVYTVYGSYHPEFEEASMLYDPIAYVGSLPAVVDPTDAETFADLSAGGEGSFGGYFYWPKDLTFRFTFADGSVVHALYPHGNMRDWELGSGPWRPDLLYFAISIPANERLVRAELLHRPFVVRGSQDETDGNIANAAFGITAQNVMDEATLVVSREF
ncbi:MAG: hypothetical protein KUG77_24950 [Nannocystaceae bacterium]|nr:hypothetical protein [Nannocystaceae bacterium]